MRSIQVALLLALSFALSSPGSAALRKYDVRVKNIAQFSTTSPKLAIRSTNGIGTAVIDESGGEPVLNKLVQVDASEGRTIDAPGLSGFIWLKSGTRQGPTGAQTGTGSTTNIVTWGDVDSWSITGGQFCNSVPAIICDFANRQDDETVPPTLLSTHYNIESWNFHSTGYVGVPWIFFTAADGGVGNAQYQYRGPRSGGGEVPALPLVGVGAVGLSIVALGVSAARRRRR